MANHRYILFGPQGSGKGTQAESLAADLKVPHIATGELLRDEVDRGSALGLKISALIAQGLLVPDEDANNLLMSKFDEVVLGDGYVLDGYPRTLAQAQFLETKAAPNQVIMLDLDDEEAFDRINGRRVCPNCHQVYHLKYQPPKDPNICDNCGTTLEIRGDDRAAAIRRRLQLYHEQTEPIADYYESLNKLTRLSALGTVEDIGAAIRQSLGIK